MKNELYPHLKPINIDKVLTSADDVNRLIEKLKSENKNFETPLIFADETIPEVIRCIITSIQLSTNQPWEDKTKAELYLCNSETIRSESSKLLSIFSLLNDNPSKDSDFFLELLLNLALNVGMKIQEHNNNIENIPSLNEHHEFKENRIKGGYAKEEKLKPEKLLVEAITTTMVEQNELYTASLKEQGAEIFQFISKYRTENLLTTNQIEARIKLTLNDLGIEVKRGNKKKMADEISNWLEIHFSDSIQSYFV